jgi:hypothetical protein
MDAFSGFSGSDPIERLCTHENIKNMRRDICCGMFALGGGQGGVRWINPFALGAVFAVAVQHLWLFWSKRPA